MIRVNEIEKVGNILAQIRQLNNDAKEYVMEQLAGLLKKDKSIPVNKVHQLTELHGLGAEIWKGIDIDGYVKNERQWD